MRKRVEKLINILIDDHKALLDFRRKNRKRVPNDQMILGEYLSFKNEPKRRTDYHFYIEEKLNKEIGKLSKNKNINTQTEKRNYIKILSHGKTNIMIVYSNYIPLVDIYYKDDVDLDLLSRIARIVKKTKSIVINKNERKKLKRENKYNIVFYLLEDIGNYNYENLKDRDLYEFGVINRDYYMRLKYRIRAPFCERGNEKYFRFWMNTYDHILDEKYIEAHESFKQDARKLIEKIKNKKIVAALVTSYFFFFDDLFYFRITGSSSRKQQTELKNYYKTISPILRLGKKLYKRNYNEYIKQIEILLKNKKKI